MTAFRYLRLDCISASGGGVYAFSEITASATIGGASVFTGGTASASSTFGGFSAAGAVDGNGATAWASTGLVSEWWQYDRGAGNAIDLTGGEMSITARTDGSANQLPFSAVLRGSNDLSSWTDIFTFVGVASPAVGQTVWAPLPTGITYFDANNRTASVTLTTSDQLSATSSAVSTVALNRQNTGKNYAEFTMTTLTGTPAVGIVNGFYNMAVGSLLGTDANSLGYRSGGGVVANNVTLATIATFAQGDRIGVAIDPVNRLIWFRVNNGNWNNNGANDPATGVGGIDYSSQNWAKTIMAVGFSATGAKWKATPASANWTDAAPSGYGTLDSVQMVTGHADASKQGGLPVTPSFASFTGRANTMPTGLRVVDGPQNLVSGVLKELGVATSGKTIRLYDKRSGEQLGCTTSDGSGNFSIPALGRPKVFAVAFDSPYNALVFDNVTPV
jgi:hypothetical protein